MFLAISLFLKKSWSNTCSVDIPYVDSSAWSLSPVSDGEDTRGWAGGRGSAGVEEWGHLSHLETWTERRLHQHSHCIPRWLHPRVSTHLGFAVWWTSWASKLSLISSFIPTGAPRGGIGDDN